jgi:hypothetical protein
MDVESEMRSSRVRFPTRAPPNTARRPQTTKELGLNSPLVQVCSSAAPCHNVHTAYVHALAAAIAKGCCASIRCVDVRSWWCRSTIQCAVLGRWRCVSGHVFVTGVTIPRSNTKKENKDAIWNPGTRPEKILQFRHGLARRRGRHSRLFTGAKRQTVGFGYDKH